MAVPLRTLAVAAFLSCRLFAGIAIDATSNAAPQGNSSSGAKWAHTVGTCTRRELVVIVSGLGSGDVASVTYGGVPLARIIKGGWTQELWGLTNPAPGTADIIASWPTMDQTSQQLVPSAISLCGVDQMNPIAASGTADTLSQTLTTSVPNTLWIGAAVAHNGTVRVSSGQTELANFTLASAAPALSTAYLANVAAGTHTLSWSATGGSGSVGVVVAAIRPAPSVVVSSIDAGLFLLPVPILAYGIQPQVITTQYQGPGSGGDTQLCASNGPGTRPGAFGGGAIVCSYNDGSGLGCGSSNVCLFEMLTYDKTNPGGTTFGLVNSLASYGAGNTPACYDGVKTMKSRAPFSLPGLLFQHIGCMDRNTFQFYQSGVIVSPDGGAHWCNYKSYLAHASSPGCDSSNWHADGDNPVDAAGFQWPLADGTNKMARLTLVDFLCQDNNTNCPVAGGVDPDYLYFSAQDSGLDKLFIARAPKSAGMAIMDPAAWQVYQGGSWTDAVQNATDQSSGLGLVNPCCGRMDYLNDYGLFVFFGQTNGTTVAVSTAPAPWGPWTVSPPMSVPDGAQQYPPPLLDYAPNTIRPAS